MNPAFQVYDTFIPCDRFEKVNGRSAKEIAKSGRTPFFVFAGKFSQSVQTFGHAEGLAGI